MSSATALSPRRWYSHGFEFSLRIPRSRSGNFYPVLLGLIRNESQERARLFNLLYTKRLTTEQIGEISDCVYGRAYSKQQVSHLASSCRDDVERCLDRGLSRCRTPVLRGTRQATDTWQRVP